MCRSCGGLWPIRRASAEARINVGQDIRRDMRQALEAARTNITLAETNTESTIESTDVPYEGYARVHQSVDLDHDNFTVASGDPWVPDSREELTEVVRQAGRIRRATRVNRLRFDDLDQAEAVEPSGLLYSEIDSTLVR
jgi:hypothetical protein